MTKSRMARTRLVRIGAAAIGATTLLFSAAPASAEDGVIKLVTGTVVLLSNSGGSGGGGSASTASTNIFSPAVYVDYKRLGAEPTVVVDRYPFQSPVTINGSALT